MSDREVEAHRGESIGEQRKIPECFAGMMTLTCSVRKLRDYGRGDLNISGRNESQTTDKRRIVFKYRYANTRVTEVIHRTTNRALRTCHRAEERRF